MSWKLRRNANNASPMGCLILCCLVCLLFFPKVTLFFGFILIIFWILDKKLDNPNKSRIKEIEERLEKIRLKLPSKNFDPNYKGSESYQALLKKYNGNIPGSGQGDNSGEKIGKRGGRFIKRISKKTGKPYRHYF